MNKDVIVYSSEFRKNNNILQILKEIFLEVKKYKWQILLSIKKKIKSTYQQDTFGLFWAILMPIIPMTVYMVLAQVKVFNTVGNMPFIFYIATGMFVWLLMSSIIRKVMMSIKAEKAILKTTNFPIIASMLSQLGGVLQDSFTRSIAVIGIVFYYQVDISLLSILAILFSFIPIIIISFSIGAILATLDMIVQDTRRIVDIFLRYGLFVSSVIVPFPTDGIFGTINNFNIFNTYVVSIRDLLYFGTLSNLDIYIYTSISSIVIFLIAMKLVYKLDFNIRAYL